MIKKLYLHHFRNIEKAEVTFSPGVNWIIGKNAQGKTNLLEAIYLLSTGRSFRTHQLNQLIQNGASFFYVEALIEKEGVEQTLKVSFDGEAKKVKFNASTFSHFTPLIGLLPHVLYAPEDMTLISGAPSFRRKCMDLHLAQIDPLYLYHLARYHKAMKQRNELLRRKTEEAIDPWEENMAVSSAYLMQKRKETVLELGASLEEHMQTLSSGKDKLTFAYQSSFSQAEPSELMQQLKKTRKKELHIGSTLFGPHRDDFQFSVADLSAKSFASIGQKQSVIAALRLSLWEHLKKKTGHPPLMSIDDFGAHLDQSRQENFQKNIGNLGQIFITATEPVEGNFNEKSILQVEDGVIKEIVNNCSARNLR